MRFHVRVAREDDIPALVALMAEFYEEAGYALPRDAAAKAFAALIAEPRHGCVWFVEVDGEPTGYIVLTLGFSMEYGGLRGFVDDFFVRPAGRRKGLGTAVLEAVKQRCHELGVRALFVETGPQDHPARALYARAGFKENGRMLLALPLAPPLHD